MSIRAHKLLLCTLLLTPLSGCVTASKGAIESGDVEAVRALLDQGKLGLDQLTMGMTDRYKPIHLAARSGQVKVLRLLLERGARVDDRTPTSATPLILAASNGHLEAVRFLVGRGADLSATSGGGNALYYAGAFNHPEVVRFLREADAKESSVADEAAAPQRAPAQAARPVDVPPAASDVDRVPSARGAKRKNAYAVVIGIGKYREKLPSADYADKDAELVAEYLTKVLGYPEENVIVRLNERATRTDLAKYFEEWLRNNVEPGASVFIYYSGHGTPNMKTGEAYLVPYDGDPTFVDSTAYPLKQLYASLDKLPAKDVTVVLDSCFSGAGGRSVLAKGARPMVLSVSGPAQAAGKTVVLAASGGDQISNSYEEKGHGLMTYYFLKGLQGDADANKDGSIAMPELFDYVKPNVQRVARRQYNNEQTPQLMGSAAALNAAKLLER